MNDWAEFRHFKYLLTIAEYQGFAQLRSTFTLPSRISVCRPNNFRKCSIFASLRRTRVAAFS